MFYKPDTVCSPKSLLSKIKGVMSEHSPEASLGEAQMICIFERAQTAELATWGLMLMISHTLLMYNVLGRTRTVISQRGKVYTSQH